MGVIAVLFVYLVWLLLAHFETLELRKRLRNLEDWKKRKEGETR